MQMTAIEEAGWDKLWFSWRGPVDPKGMFYYRVHGPRVLIEYNRQKATRAWQKQCKMLGATPRLHQRKTGSSSARSGLG